MLMDLEKVYDKVNSQLVMWKVGADPEHSLRGCGVIFHNLWLTTLAEKCCDKMVNDYHVFIRLIRREEEAGRNLLLV